MKADELMIGDWIAYPPKTPQKVTAISASINDKGETEYEFFNDVEWYPVRKAQPIPLTPEILEKNGWYIPDDGLWWRHSVAPFLMSERTYGYYLYADSEHDKREFFCIINYVHQLQHALRLCGIEKEIVL